MVHWCYWHQFLLFIFTMDSQILIILCVILFLLFLRFFSCINGAPMYPGEYFWASNTNLCFSIFVCVCSTLCCCVYVCVHRLTFLWNRSNQAQKSFALSGLSLGSISQYSSDKFDLDNKLETEFENSMVICCFGSGFDCRNTLNDRNIYFQTKSNFKMIFFFVKDCGNQIHFGIFNWK